MTTLKIYIPNRGTPFPISGCLLVSLRQLTHRNYMLFREVKNSKYEMNFRRKKKLHIEVYFSILETVICDGQHDEVPFIRLFI